MEYLLAHSPKVLGTKDKLSLVEGYFRSLVDMGILEPDYVRDDASVSPLNETDNHLKKIAEDHLIGDNFLDTSFIRAQITDPSKMESTLTKMIESLAVGPQVTIETYLVNSQ